MNHTIKRYLFLLLFFFSSIRAEAGHIYGADFFYWYVSGNTYTLVLVLYADCRGLTSQNDLSYASPRVHIYNGNTIAQYITLNLIAPTGGMEVTPVCAAQLNNTQCVNTGNVIPGIKKYTYKTNITLSGASANWRFRVTDSLGYNSNTGNWMTAGRSGNFTNLSGSGFLQMEARLNNSVVTSNSSPAYNTIPTPFFVTNKQASFNPGTVDADGDVLTYELVPGLDGISGTVAYAPGYTAKTPLSASPGSFNFDSTNGQLQFIPNNSQRSLVVYRVTERRNGVLIGTSMREMTFVSLPGSNDPPLAGISNVTGGRKTDSVTVKACQGSFAFQLKPTDPNGDNITISAVGLPAGASFSTISNGTAAPVGNFIWNTSSVTPGTYTFFVTYTDDGCPLMSKQTIAYTVEVLGQFGISYHLLTPPTCTQKAAYTVSTSGAGNYCKIKVFLSGAAIDSATNLTGNTVTDSLFAGTYLIRVYNEAGCYRDTNITITINIPTRVHVTYDQPTCNGYTDGGLYVSAYNSVAPYLYALNTGSFSSTSSFTGLGGGVYTLHVKDGDGCIKDTVLTLSDSVTLTAAINASNILCNGDDNGVITVAGTHSAYGGPYVYLLDGVTQASNIMNNLAPATYIVRAEDVKGCYLQDTITITEPAVLLSQYSFNNISCFGSNDGLITMAPTGGTPAYNYSLNGNPFTTVPVFRGLSKGQYIIEVKDRNGCTDHDTVTILEPTAIRITNLSLTHPLCYDSLNGTITVNATGGVPPYIFSAQGNSSSTGIITGLGAGDVLVRITDNNDCTKDTIVVLASPPRIYATIGIKQATCATLDDGMLTVQGNGGFGQYTYALDSSAFTVQTVYSPLGGGNYVVRVKDINNCIIDTNIIVKDSLYIYTTATVTDASCNGYKDGSIMLVPGGGVAPYTAAFDGSAYTPAMDHTGQSMGTYSISVKDALGCIGDTIISISEPEVLLADTDIVYNNCYGNTLVSRIAVNVTGGTRPYTYAWSTGYTGGDSIMLALQNGSYTIKVQDAHGCNTNADALLEYKDCCTPFMPTAFTPNGDGKNDIFRLVSKGDIRLKELQVFNRFGQRIFTTTSTTGGWDGTFNGQPAPLGTYYYFLKAYCGNNDERLVETKGDIILIR